MTHFLLPLDFGPAPKGVNILFLNLLISSEHTLLFIHVNLLFPFHLNKYFISDFVALKKCQIDSPRHWRPLSTKHTYKADFCIVLQQCASPQSRGITSGIRGKLGLSKNSIFVFSAEDCPQWNCSQQCFLIFIPVHWELDLRPSTSIGIGHQTVILW